MNDNHLQNNNSHNSKKNLFIMMFNQLFHSEPKNRDELLKLIKDFEKNKLIDLDTRDMLEGVMEIAEQRIRDIMIPRSQMVVLKKNQSLQECLKIIVKSTHSRFPVISEDKDHAEGILLAKDLLPFMLIQDTPSSIEEILRPTVIVPESKRVDRMLKEFRSHRHHIAIVINEFGNVSGMVTMEDVLELIVGRIDDEFHYEDNDIRQLNRNTFAIRALTTIDSFNEFFNAQFNNIEADTIGGLIMKAFSHLPVRGETIKINQYTFKVAMANSRRIIQLHVKIPEHLL